MLAVCVTIGNSGSTQSWDNIALEIIIRGHFWDPTLEPYLETQSEDPFLVPNHGTKPWDPTSGPNQHQYPFMGPELGTQLWVPPLRINLGTL